MENHTAKHFAIQLGALASLYLSLAFLLVLLFSIINLAIPDATDSYWQVSSYADSVRYGIAVLVVFFPTYILLTRLVNNSRRTNTKNNYLELTKWLIYLSLLVGGAVLLGDLVAVILSFLGGEITTRFILKATSVLLVVGAAFTYYIYDAQGFWLRNEKISKLCGLIASVVVVSSIVFGFTQIENPSAERERTFDQQQLTDLREMQWRIEDYLFIEGTLPNSLSEAYRGAKTPEAPSGRPDYEYQITEEGFALCATFSAANSAEEFALARPITPHDSDQPTILNPHDWAHDAGYHCFLRSIHSPSE